MKLCSETHRMIFISSQTWNRCTLTTWDTYFCLIPFIQDLQIASQIIITDLYSIILSICHLSHVSSILCSHLWHATE